MDESLTFELLSQFPRALEALSWFQPAVLELGREQVDAWMAETPELAVYAFMCGYTSRLESPKTAAPVTALAGQLGAVDRRATACYCLYWLAVGQ